MAALLTSFMLSYPGNIALHRQEAALNASCLEPASLPRALQAALGERCVGGGTSGYCHGSAAVGRRSYRDSIYLISY